MSIRSIWSFIVRSRVVAAALVILLGMASGSARAQGRSGAVYVLTNQTTGNSVIVYHRAPDGTLSFSGIFSTGGTGIGTGTNPVDPLGSQRAVVLSEDHHLLFAVNSGSNEISAFAVKRGHLQLLDTLSSGGTMPVSIAVHGSLVYVLNAGGEPNITGFTIDRSSNHLVLLHGSQRSLAGGSAAAPAQVSFSPDGSVLMVTEKGTQTIDTYTVDDDGYASDPMAHVSSGATPFGFDFTHRGIVVVSEAGPNALSSYELEEDGGLKLVTGSLANGQKATCWAVATDDGRFAYTANAASGTISSYGVTRDGTLSLLDPTSGVTAMGAAPTDMALSSDSRFLYVREGGTHSVGGFRVEEDGSLTPVGTVDGIPAGAQGIAAF
jgi:6-phosphogluconolactonase (cycloisomerase 2 family)